MIIFNKDIRNIINLSKILQYIMKIFGIKVFYYIKCMSTYIKFVLCALNENNEKYTIEIDAENNVKIQKVSNFHGFSLILKKQSNIQIPNIYDYVNNNTYNYVNNYTINYIYENVYNHAHEHLCNNSYDNLSDCISISIPEYDNEYRYIHEYRHEHRYRHEHIYEYDTEYRYEHHHDHHHDHIHEQNNNKDNMLVNIENHLSLNKTKYYYFLLNNINAFSKTDKYKYKRPVWFFKGTDTYSKNFIADKTNISKYFIDKYNFIPDLIECDIIVFPDKYDINDSEIKQRCVGNNEYISVLFEHKVTNNIGYFFRKKRYIYIFIGEPNIGKTYLANSLGIHVFETKYHSTLPTYIEENIIIIGNDKVYDIDLDILPRFKGNCIFIYVEFNYI